MKLLLAVFTVCLIAATDQCEHGHFLPNACQSTCACDCGWTGPLCNQDLDECLLPEHGCAMRCEDPNGAEIDCPSELCTNSDGSYTCHECPEDFNRVDDACVDSYLRYETQAWNQQRSTSSYLYQTDLPALSELTACYRYEELDTNDLTVTISIATTGSDFGNALLLARYPSENWQVWLDNKITVIAEGQNPQDWTGTRKYCLTWKAGGSIKWYVDDVREGRAELQATVAAADSETIPAGGTLVMMMDQDSKQGGFNVAQVAIGRVSEINIWDYEMTEEQVMSLTNADTGNLVNSETLEIHGENWYEDISLKQYVGN